MRRFCFAASSLIALIFCIAVHAGTPIETSERSRDPARLLPDSIDLLIQTPQPRRLVETLTTLDTLKQIRQLAPIREFFDSTGVRRFLQLIAYFEKELDAPWPQLLDRLAGHGIVFGVQFGPKPAPMLLVVEGDDEKLMRQFFQLGLKIIEQELVRQEAKDKPIKGSHKGDDTARIGSEFHAAVAGGALFLSNSEKMLHDGLDRRRTGKKSMADVPGVRAADKLLPPEPLISFWLNMKSARKASGSDDSYKGPPRDDPGTTVLLGHYIDLLGRTPFICAGVYPEKDGFRAAIRMPRGRHGMGLDQLLHVPPPGKPGSRPLLEPKNVLYSESDYFNLANVWKERTALWSAKQAQALEKFDKQSAPFLLGGRLSKLLMQTGPYYRFVIAHQKKTGYKKIPKISIPAFALIWELREPEAFNKTLEPVLRGAALLGGFQASLQLVEERYKNCKLIGYRFSEGRPLKGDVDDLRFNFTPCFTRVGDQFIVSSTIDLCRELVDLIHKEGASPARGSVSTARIRLYGSGVAAYLRTIEDLLMTQTALDQAVTPREARRQVKTFFDVIRGLGVLSMEPRFLDKTFQYDIRLRPISTTQK